MGVQIAFKTLPGSQSLVVSCPCNDILNHGTRGPGKTFAQLVKFRRYVGLGYGEYWRGVIFDTTYKNLDDIVAQSLKIFKRFNDGAEFLASKGDYKWRWPTGEQLLFRVGVKESDYNQYHGHEYPYQGFNELTKYPDSKFMDAMDSCFRSSFKPEIDSPDLSNPLPKIPYIRLSTTNPHGIGHNWVKKRYIDPAEDGQIVTRIVEITNPLTDVITKVELTQVAIKGHWVENTFLDPITIAKYHETRDPNKRAAWVDGDWNIQAGGRFNHLWDHDTHVIDPFVIPDGWIVDRSHDWGESKPFANLWFAESDGTEATLEDGRKWCPAAGTIILIGEWYGCRKDEENKGLGMSSRNVAKGVAYVDSIITGTPKERPASFDGQLNVIQGLCKKVEPGPADTSIFTRNPDGYCINDNFDNEGVIWLEADKSPGSRINGAEIICSRLEAAIDVGESGVPEDPAFYAFSNCRGFISRVPDLPRSEKNQDDVDTDAEDHDYDAFRYRTLHKREKLIEADLGSF